MTVEEAIEILNTKAHLDCKIEEAIDEMKARCVAIEALEKQIPKKVIFEDDGEVLLCPRCGLDLMGSITDPDHDPYYCFECGQALEWGEEE